ncbi:putative Sigma-K factor-processing regulatory protein BofA [[Clostridium] ultunense Esp]|uniref:pro-sigmaK processing inhibitor BofA family protein n=1 Tax=Thermicanus aegyptius TaxID=94009 RepID=UPI0002B6F342|nr:pro-sigmaK processing inhibitor BofA family protein [Thermicanus aegyptius]CCQ94085.1 putative Sigma-K factor-processing regulatory protein BofA [[Clostridium] ultunense Esp]
MNPKYTLLSLLFLPVLFLMFRSERIKRYYGKISRFFVRILFSALGLYLFNLGAQFFSFSLPINLYTVITFAFLGVPGLLLLVVLKGLFP